VRASAIEWELLYQAVTTDPNQQPLPITSVLQGGPTAPMNSFHAGLPGIYNVILFSPGVAGSTGKTIYAGSGSILDGTARLWVQNQFLGTRKFEKPIHAVLLIIPNGQLLARVDPIQVQQSMITEMSGNGFFDSAAGRLDLHLVLNISGQISGAIDITISTDKTITPPQEASVSGQRREANNHISLVGDAPIVGPTGTTHGWLQVEGQLSAV
jgi:hypothetical protein